MWASGFAPDPLVDDTGATPLRPPRTHAPSTVSGGPIHAAEVVPGEAAGSGSGEESRVLATGATHRDTRADNESYDRSRALIDRAARAVDRRDPCRGGGRVHSGRERRERRARLKVCWRAFLSSYFGIRPNQPTSTISPGTTATGISHSDGPPRDA